MATRHTYRSNVPSEMGRDAFLAVFGGVYEHSPWIAAQAWDQGLTAAADTAEGLHAVLSDVVAQAGLEPQNALLRAHPDLAGKLALAGDLTAESGAEQAGAGLDRCSPAELDAFQALNRQYRARFGFPFIVAVAGLDRADILDAFRQRVDNDAETEFDEALRQVHRIALLRLRRID